MKFYLTAVIALFLCAAQYAEAQQVVKKLKATRTNSVIKIDGVADEPAWALADTATNFFEWRPNNNQPEQYNTRTEIKLLYDDRAVYVSGFCYEQKDSIISELVGRDVVGSNDFVGVIFDTYNDKINGTGFYVTALGEQFDAKYSANGNEDPSWNAVWESKAKIHANGWSFEMKIPYSALRFSTQNHTWGLNITRRRNKIGKQYMWNPLLQTISGFINQEGEWVGLQDLKPPIRLQFSPYFSAYINHYPYNTSKVKNTTAAVNGGMDVKWGLGSNFTLDMTLIPDFGQVQSDRRVLNLTPFEVVYTENRPFFTEGTELFTQGNLLYTRRIGAEPIRKWDVYDKLQANEDIIKNPSETKLLNAIKISGRTKQSLGLGFFNAVTQPMYATVEDTLTKSKRKINTSTLTNYNIFVVDKALKNNSSIGIINLNTLRSGADRDANVTAVLGNFNNKKNTYNVSFKLATSTINEAAVSTTGYSHKITVGKTGGQFNWELGQELQNKNYDINDLGQQNYNDFMDNWLWGGYNSVKASKWYNTLNANSVLYISKNLTYQKIQDVGFEPRINVQLKNLWYVGINSSFMLPAKNFYEARTKGFFVNSKGYGSMRFWFSSNTAKKYYIDFAYRRRYNNLLNGRSNYFGWGQRYRFNNKLSISSNFTFDDAKNMVGYATRDANGNPVFSRRQQKTAENTLSIKYNLNPMVGLTVNVRHYWSQVKPHEYFYVQKNGSLQSTSAVTQNTNTNLNLFNVDAVFFWQFAPGSFVNIVWKNYIENRNQDILHNYFYNTGYTFRQPQNNTLSLKVIYFIDWVDFRKNKKNLK